MVSRRDCLKGIAGSLVVGGIAVATLGNDESSDGEGLQPVKETSSEVPKNETETVEGGDE